MIDKIFIFLTKQSPKVKRRVWRFWYQLFAKSYQKHDLQFLNFGFCDLNSELTPLYLEEKDENNRYPIQLYNHVATATDLKGKQVLEVGSGRGGGAAYVASYLEPEKMIGVDIASQNVQLSRQMHQLPNLSFQQGDAEALPFENDTFDVVLNVESSHCYGSMTQFLQEVYRVLKSGGIFSWTDILPIDDLESLQQTFASSGLHQIKYTDITQNVLRALELISEPKQNYIQTYMPGFLKNYLQEISVAKDSKLYKSLENRQLIYLSYVFRK